MKSRRLLSRCLAILVTAILGWAGVLQVNAQPPEEPDDAFKRIGIIGLDTSHVIAFTRLFNDPDTEGPESGWRVVAAYPPGSPDIESSVSRIPRYTAEIQEFGVEIVDSIEALIERVDAVLLHTNDGRPHLNQAVPVLRAGKPLFIDKPLAASLVDAIVILELGERWGTPVFSSSSLRFAPEAQQARRGELVGDVLGCDTVSPAHLEPTHPDLFWYGIHGVEQLFTVMGTGCETVTRISTEHADVVVGLWGDGRIGTYRGMRTGPSYFAGTVWGSTGRASTGGHQGYQAIVRETAQFFDSGKPPVAAAETIEIFAFMTAADLSKQRGGAPVPIAEVLRGARADAEEKLASFD